MTLLTAMALGVSVFCQTGFAAEQESGGTSAATDVAASPASVALASSVASASETNSSDKAASSPTAPDTKGPSATAPDAAAPVCFKLTSHCIDSRTQRSTVASGTGTSGHSSRDAKAGKDRPLNLNAPDVRSVVPIQELKDPLPTPEEQSTAEETNTVQVSGDTNTPDVPGGFGALWWAIRNPSQAWRIFTPVQ